MIPLPDGKDPGKEDFKGKGGKGYEEDGSQKHGWSVVHCQLSVVPDRRDLGSEQQNHGNSEPKNRRTAEYRMSKGGIATLYLFYKIGRFPPIFRVPIPHSLAQTVCAMIWFDPTS
jgi:hypothetical protein